MHNQHTKVLVELVQHLKIHPGNAVNALATGDQSDTTYGWHKDKNDRVKANRAHTEHNNNKYEGDRQAYRDEDHSGSGHKRLYKENKSDRRDENANSRDQRREDEYDRKESQETNGKTTGHWFWKKSN